MVKYAKIEKHEKIDWNLQNDDSWVRKWTIKLKFDGTTRVGPVVGGCDRYTKT